jgi:hypothetical protein
MSCGRRQRENAVWKAPVKDWLHEIDAKRRKKSEQKQRRREKTAKIKTETENE